MLFFVPIYHTLLLLYIYIYWIYSHLFIGWVALFPFIGFIGCLKYLILLPELAKGCDWRIIWVYPWWELPTKHPSSQPLSIGKRTPFHGGTPFMGKPIWSVIVQKWLIVVHVVSNGS